MNEQLDNDVEKEYVEDFLSVVLNKKINLNNPNPIDMLNLHFIMIMTEIIECEEFHILKYIISIYSIDKNKIVTEIIKILTNNENLSIYKITKWLYENDKNLFYEFINVFLSYADLIIIRDYETIKFLFESDLSNNEYNQLNKKLIYNVTLNIFFSFTEQKLIEIKNKYIYSDFNYILLMIELCLSEESYTYKVYPNKECLYLDVLSKILINKYSELKIITKFISHYKLDTQQIITFFEENISILTIIETNSFEKIDWFFNIVPDYTKFITKNNYLQTFLISCETSNCEISKYIYNIICVSGFQITKTDLSMVLRIVIRSQKCVNIDYKIIYELINLGIKPPSGYPKLDEYYKNIKIYNNLK